MNNQTRKGKSMPSYDLGHVGLLSENVGKVSMDELLREYKTRFKEMFVVQEIKMLGHAISVASSSTGFGGTRLWFVCPSCKRRCGVMYQNTLKHQIGCRVCMSVKYRKQRYKGMVEGENPLTRPP